MTLIDRPWARVRNPVPIPEDCTVEHLSAMTEIDLAELIRSHLRNGDLSAEGKKTWDHFWRVLKSSRGLAKRAFNILEDFLDTTDRASSDPGIEPAQAKRMETFQTLCEHAERRIERIPTDGPLAWAGSAADFQPRARQVIATLVGAIARHRSALEGAEIDPTSDDIELWAVLRRVSLDPNDYPHSEDCS